VAVGSAQEALAAFAPHSESTYLSVMRTKLGLATESPEDVVTSTNFLV